MFNKIFSLLGEAADLFTGALFNRYSAPPGFCFDVLCDDDPLITDMKSVDYNLDKKIKKFIEYVQAQGKYYLSENIILTMGDDFHFQDAHEYFKNLDKLIRYFLVT